jgi:hypothetical protein
METKIESGRTQASTPRSFARCFYVGDWEQNGYHDSYFSVVWWDDAAMRAAGIDCWSCDLLPADDGSPHHIVGDVLEVMRSREWAAFGLHPDCTFLTVAGIHWNSSD